MASPIPLPASDPIARPRDWIRYPDPRRDRDPREGQTTDPWLKYLTTTAQAVSLTAQRITIVEASAQTASSPSLVLDLGSNPAGIYTVRYYVTIQRAAGTSSSLTLTLAWTQGGLAKSYSPAALTANTTQSVLTGTATFRLDHAAPVAWSTTYASSGSPSMQYAVGLLAFREA